MVPGTTPTIVTLEPRARSIAEALALSSALPARARAEGRAWLAASIVEGPAVLLGSVQRAGRVVDLEACARERVDVFRRASSGTAAYVGRRALFFSLALPHPRALAPDTTPATLLNRNVRGFLKGFSRAGALAHYFGREWIAVAHRPAALLGFDVTPAGAVLLEVVAPLEASLALPASITAPEERALDRWRGRIPLALGDALPRPRAAEELAREVCEGLAARWAATLRPASDDVLGSLAPLVALSDPRDPVPPDLVLGPAVAVPIGALEAAANHGTRDAVQRIWLGGDVLAPSHVLNEVARAVASGADIPPSLHETAIEGARIEDMIEAARAAIEASTKD